MSSVRSIRASRNRTWPRDLKTGLIRPLCILVMGGIAGWLHGRQVAPSEGKGRDAPTWDASRRGCRRGLADNAVWPLLRFDVSRSPRTVFAGHAYRRTRERSPNGHPCLSLGQGGTSGLRDGKRRPPNPAVNRTRRFMTSTERRRGAPVTLYVRPHVYEAIRTWRRRNGTTAGGSLRDCCLSYGASFDHSVNCAARHHTAAHRVTRRK